MATINQTLRPRRPVPWGQIAAYGLLTIGAVVVLYPFFYMLMNSVKPGREILHSPNALPTELTWSGYTGVFQRLPVLRLVFNSLFLAVATTLLNTALSALAAYAIAKIPFP